MKYYLVINTLPSFLNLVQGTLYPLTHLLTDSLTHILTHIPTHSLTHILTHVLTYSCLRCGIIGKQTCPKFNRTNETELDIVYVVMTIARLKQVNTDLLITINIPCEHSGKSPLPNGNDKSINFNYLLTNPVGIKALVNVMDIVNSIEIHDWSLFA